MGNLTPCGLINGDDLTYYKTWGLNMTNKIPLSDLYAGIRLR